jgi:hypothetical protein
MSAPTRIVFVILLATKLYSQVPVSFCDLVQNPDKYDAKEVTVRATWKYGYEWSYLYCLDCLDKGKAWLEIPFNADDPSLKLLKHTPKGAGIVNLTVEGTFRGRGSFGHMGGYPYLFTVRKISNLVVVQKGMKDISEEEKTEKKWVCGGTNPK